MAEAGSLNVITRMEVFVDDTRVLDKSDKKISETVSVSNGPYRTIKVKATDNKGNSAEASVHIGVNQAYATPTPVATATATP